MTEDDPMRTPRPHEVFTPARLPLAESNVYAHRTEAEAALQRYFDRGQVPVVFGEYGVGKTTVVRRFFSEEESLDRVVYMSSAAGKSLRDLFTQILEHVGYTVETQIDRKQDSTAEIGSNIFLQAKLNSVSSISSRFELAVSSPTDAGMIDVMTEYQLIVIIDEAHRAIEEFRQELSDFIKATRGHNEQYPFFVIIGTTLDAETLVRHDPGIDRFIKELLVKPLTDDEARFIVTKGFSTLRLQVPEPLIDKIVRTAAGAPSIVQYVCLEIAENALRRGEVFIVDSDYTAAIKTYLEEHGRRLVSVYVKAIEQVGPKRYRKKILAAMAEIRHDYVNMDELRKGVSALLGEDVPAQALSGPLRELKIGNDSILQDVSRMEGERVHNLTTFRDPMMKSFIRFMGEVESQGLLPASTI